MKKKTNPEKILDAWNRIRIENPNPESGTIQPQIVEKEEKKVEQSSGGRVSVKDVDRLHKGILARIVKYRAERVIAHERLNREKAEAILYTPVPEISKKDPIVEEHKEPTLPQIPIEIVLPNEEGEGGGGRTVAESLNQFSKEMERIISRISERPVNVTVNSPPVDVNIKMETPSKTVEKKLGNVQRDASGRIMGADILETEG